MTKLHTDLTSEQSDFAIFLPAISSFYQLFIGKQRFNPNYVEASRMPAGIPEMEMINFLNDQEGIFHYKWALYSAGHANLNLNKVVPREDMIRNRGPHTELVADSGGFQIGKGRWVADWLDPNDKVAEKYRKTVLNWLCKISDYSMTLDIPTWSCTTPAADKINIHSFDDAIKATQYNHEYFMKHAFGDVKFLNVLQGSNHTEADVWYEQMKEYNDPTKHDKFFRGWAMGAANMADPHLALKRIVTIINDGLLEPGKHDRMHFLGTSKLEWAVLLTAIQRAVRRHHNPNFTISFDCASPFLATANGRVYTHSTMEHGRPWSYQMELSIDDKKYATDPRSFKDVVTGDKHFRETKTVKMRNGARIIHPKFVDSPISERLKISDICIYAPGDLNRIGQEGRTSWDSFSFALLMAHNVWHHIYAVQESNRRADQGIFSNVLYDEMNGLSHADIIEAIFATPDYEERLEIIDNFSKFWMGFSGARGLGGKNAITAAAQFDSMFELDVEKALQDEEMRLQLKPAKQESKVVDDVVNNLFDFGD